MASTASRGPHSCRSRKQPRTSCSSRCRSSPPPPAGDSTSSARRSTRASPCAALTWCASSSARTTTSRRAASPRRSPPDRSAPAASPQTPPPGSWRSTGGRSRCRPPAARSSRRRRSTGSPSSAPPPRCPTGAETRCASGILSVGRGASGALVAGLDPLFDLRPAPLEAVAQGNAGVTGTFRSATVTYDVLFPGRPVVRACPDSTREVGALHIQQHVGTFAWQSPCRCFKAAALVSVDDCGNVSYRATLELAQIGSAVAGAVW